MMFVNELAPYSGWLAKHLVAFLKRFHSSSTRLSENVIEEFTLWLRLIRYLLTVQVKDDRIHPIYLLLTKRFANVINKGGVTSFRIDFKLTLVLNNSPLRSLKSVECFALEISF